MRLLASLLASPSLPVALSSLAMFTCCHVTAPSQITSFQCYNIAKASKSIAVKNLIMSVIEATREARVAKRELPQTVRKIFAVWRHELHHV